MINHLRTILHSLGPDLVALVFFTLVWFWMMIFYGVRIHLVEGSTLLPSLVVVFLIFSSSVSHFFHHRFKENTKEKLSIRIRKILRHWLPLIWLVGVYETFRDYTGILRPDSIDDQLLQWDLTLFGVEPVIWIQKFIHPVLTDYFALMYMLYFFLPMLVATLLYTKGWLKRFQELTLSCILCMYTGFLLYLLFPAGPPRFHSELAFDPVHLSGFWGLYDFTQHQMDSSSFVLHHSSFPSLHAALSLLAVLHAWRHGQVWKKTFLVGINTWIAVSIWIATIYLRHHWLVDLFAGWILGALAFVAAMVIQKYWDRLRPNPAWEGLQQRILPKTLKRKKA